ncbi:uncharacterized protein [Periplaneta americana]|uniref:uncharacterized protein n=1 Tax=Periplaneta americana TaxID=6978 RepID=UPI0037E71564
MWGPEVPRAYIYNKLAQSIGIIDLILSVAILVLLIGELTHIIPGRGRYAVLMATDVDLRDLPHHEYRYVILATFLYLVLEALSYGMFIFATIAKKRVCIIPWTVCKFFRLIQPIVVSSWYKIADYNLQWTFLVILAVNFVVVGASIFIVMKAVESWPQSLQWCFRHRMFHAVQHV